MHAPLKVTTDYSLLKSLIKISNLIPFLLSKNISACGICDENLYGVMDFYNACKSNGIKPIIGLEIKLNAKRIYLYAKNYDGYKNLLKIHTIVETRELSIVDIKNYKNNILVVVPYTSRELYDELEFIEYLYIGYTNEFEKSNGLIITPNIIYIPDLRCLSMEDVQYMDYLDALRHEENKDYSSNYYQSPAFIDEKKNNDFIALIDIEIPTSNRYIPKYTANSQDFLVKLALKGLKKRLNGEVPETYLKRLKYELDVIVKMGFVDYFLIVYDYVLYAKKNNILVGCRGSAAGSLVSYSIGITDIDPMQYNLLFERFLNPERVTMPDIDMDFDAQKREEVISYVRNKYGNNNVALGLTFNTLKSKLVLRELGKILKVDEKLLDRFVKNIDGFKSLKDNLENPNIKKYLSSYKELDKLYRISIKLEGIKKNTSTHAAGVVISSIPLDEVIPIHIENGAVITGITMEYLENLGLLKMDFLGLKNLTIISNIQKKINIDLNNINLNDHKVYELFKNAKTDGIFQFDTSAMKALLLKLKPNSFSDLVAGVALGRPGPKDHVLEYIQRKGGKKPVTYLDPDLEPILKETNGILIYQEQVMAILVKFANYKMSEADLIRRAISKKKDNVIKEEFSKFVKRAMDNGYKKEVAIDIYNLIAKFASYGFNKSHSVAYAKVAYEMAYLKTYYPAYFISELLNDSKDISKNNAYLNYLKSTGIKIYKPSCINKESDFHIANNCLYMPLWIIKNISTDIAQKITDTAVSGYQDIFDFAYKTKEFMTEGIFTILVEAGALDFTGLNKKTMIENIVSIFNYADIADDDGLIAKPVIVEYPEYEPKILNELEIKSYGFYISNHPASRYNTNDYVKMSNIDKYLFKKIKCVILIDDIKKIKTKSNDDMAFISGNDETGTKEFTVFPKTFPMLNNLNKNDLVEINGEVSKRFDKISIIVNNIKRLGE